MHTPLSRITGTEWTIEESNYHPANESIGGTQFCTGNGFLGLRGSYEELGTKEVQGLYAAGVYRRSAVRQFCVADTFCRKKFIFDEELMPTPENIFILQNLPDPLFVKIRLNGIPFRLWDGKLLHYRRTLDLRAGILHRSVRWDDGTGRITNLSFRRFCSMSERHLIAQEITITPENWSGEAGIESGIDASLNTEYTESPVRDMPSGIFLKSGIEGSGIVVFQFSDNRVLTADSGNILWREETKLRRHRKICTLQAREGEPLTLHKFSSVCSNRDTNPEQLAVEVVQRATSAGFEKCLEANKDAWQSLWALADVRIDGDPDAQRLVRYALFHLLIASPREDSRISIGAKALSGPGYSGHVFWDTEINLAPFYHWVLPDWGRSHQNYRLRMLDDARDYAATEGRTGARFPWQTSIEGFEHAPVAITCSRTQIHVVLDVAYSALRYADISGDGEWLNTGGKEVVTECARYMEQRVLWNEEEKRYEIHGVGGPDEYHPVGNNNAYTNYLSSYVFRRAAAIAEDRSEALRWHAIAEKMYCPVDDSTWLIPQCDGFHNLKEQWETTGSDWGGPGAEYHECKGLKQPDVLLLLTLLPEQFHSGHLRANWDYYEKFILHGSSLSPSIHALAAAKLGLPDRARHYFDLSANFDFVDYNKDTGAGIHIGNFGGLWQALVYGFAGLEMHGTELRFEPRLLPGWNFLSFRIQFRGNVLRVKAENSTMEISSAAENPAPVTISVFGKTRSIRPGQTEHFNTKSVTTSPSR